MNSLHRIYHTSLFYLTFTFCIPAVFAQQIKLLPLDGTAFHYFGETVALSNDGAFVIVGADGDNEHGDNAGAAYVFARNGAKFTQTAKLAPKDIEEYDFFGRSVAINANGAWAVVGAPGDDDNGGSSGSVYVFYRENESWKSHAKLLAGDGDGQDSFGETVAISGGGDVILIGAPRDDDKATDAGSAYVFRRTGDLWKQETKLTASDGVQGHLFGYVLSLSPDGSHALFGVENDEVNGTQSGSAYIFAHEGGKWLEQTKILPHDGHVQDFFGHSVALSKAGQVVLIGAHGDDDGGASSGSAYVYTREGTRWSFSAKITAQDAAIGDLFGEAVSLDAAGKYVLIGAWGDDDGEDLAGSAYMIELKGNSWTEKAKLHAQDPGTGDQFGESLALSPDGAFAVIGVAKDDDMGDFSGSAYVFGGTSLPVELTRFIATSDASSVLLKWETASEHNNAGFHVEQQIDDGWQDLTFVDGAGNTSEPQIYQHHLHDLNPGHHRFRLKQVDFDGTFTYSDIVEVTIGVSGQYALQLAGPHPVRNQAAWILTLPTGQTIAVSVYDMLGRRTAVLYDGWIAANSPLRLAWGAGTAAAGTYLVHIEGERFVSTQPFVLVP